MNRDGLVAHYADEGHGVDVTLIPEIDYFLIQPDGQTLSLAEAAKAGAPFDWVMASHVIEHVPDVIGWLADVAELVADDGSLVLAVPDKRYTFDLHRPPTTVGQMLEAHLNRDERPSVRAVYDHFSSAVQYNHSDLWQGGTTGYDARMHTIQEATSRSSAPARASTSTATSGCTRPTPSSTRCASCGCLAIRPGTSRTRSPPLGRRSSSGCGCAGSRGTPTRRASQPREVVAATDRPEWVEHQADQQRVETLEHRIGLLEGLLTSSQEQVGRLTDRLEARRVRLRRLEERTDKMAKGFEEKRESDKEATRQPRRRLKWANDRRAEQEAEIARLRSRPWHRLRRR